MNLNVTFCFIESDAVTIVLTQTNTTKKVRLLVRLMFSKAAKYKKAWQNKTSFFSKYPTFTCSNSKIETLEKDAKYVQS